MGDDRVRILLVEDDNSVREAYKIVLELHDYDVHEARNGRDALELVDSWEAKVDLVISDLVMPYMNGFELYEALESVQEDVRMLIITGYPMPGAGKTLVERPGVRWVQKPIHLVQLTTLVRELTEP